LVVGALWLLGFGCGSSTPPAPIPDPGGPFHTKVPSDTTLDALTADQTQELCDEILVAERAYLSWAIVNELTCREGAIEAANLSAKEPRDGGAGDGAFLSACQNAYDYCEQNSASPPLCQLPTSCGATVELLSACLNEIANTDPVTACVTTPTCAMFAAGSTGLDAGASICQTGGGPPLPACARLWQQCPGAQIFEPPY
jgi:hypothetical protein